MKKKHLKISLSIALMVTFLFMGVATGDSGKTSDDDAYEPVYEEIPTEEQIDEPVKEEPQVELVNSSEDEEVPTSVEVDAMITNSSEDEDVIIEEEPINGD